MADKFIKQASPSKQPGMCAVCSLQYPASSKPKESYRIIGRGSQAYVTLPSFIQQS